jgi:DNA-directed RNA polymerase specialized sigma24 family protein
MCDRDEIAAIALRAATKTLRRFRGIPWPVRQELAQEAALRTWLSAGVRNPATFAGCVATRLAIDWLRRRARAREVGAGELPVLPESVSWSGRVEAALDLERVYARIADAPGVHRETLVAYVEGLTIEEMLATRPAGARGLARDVLYKRRRRALEWIRDEVGLAA